MSLNYEQTISYMYNALPMFQYKGKEAIKPKLTNIINFCQLLNQPQESYPTIHIGGTNGKGSSSSGISSILQEAGYKVGLYTSPHLKDFRERIKINGEMISKDFVINFIASNRSFLEKEQLSFFEMTVGMAFTYFAEQKVDFAIIEVGLGGKYDSTNIIKPEVSLITNIGFDHTDILGNSIEKIAYQKAGIIKKNTPIVISEHTPESLKVFKEVAQSLNATLHLMQNEPIHYSTDLQGIYQSKNIKGIVGVIRVLQAKGYNILEEHIVRGLQKIVTNTHLQGRWQTLSTLPLIICDTGHNPHGLSQTIPQILSQKYTTLRMVIGFVRDKDLLGILAMLPKNAIYYFCCPNIPRGLSVEFLQEKAHSLGLQGRAFSSVKEAFIQAKTDALTTDFIFIGGSTFVVAEVV